MTTINIEVVLFPFKKDHSGFKYVLINIFKSLMDQMTMCNVKGVAHSD